LAALQGAYTEDFNFSSRRSRTRSCLLAALVLLVLVLVGMAALAVVHKDVVRKFEERYGPHAVRYRQTDGQTGRQVAGRQIDHIQTDPCVGGWWAVGRVVKEVMRK
jgi:hypothetical protein